MAETWTMEVTWVVGLNGHTFQQLTLDTVLCYCSCPDEKESDCDSPIESNDCGDLSLTKEKTFDLQTVSPHSFGQGLPYAPEGWPNPCDVWGWKVLKRSLKCDYSKHC